MFNYKKKIGDIHADVIHRMKLEWLKWRAITGVLCDKKIFLKIKGKLMNLVFCETK